MKKSVIILFFICVTAVFGEPAPSFDAVVDFKITLKQLDFIAEKGDLAQVKNKFLILDGALNEYIVKKSSESEYIVEIELIDGEWDGVTNVYMYKCLISFSGGEYKKLFPERRRSTPAPDEIALNTNIIVVAKVKDVKKVGGKIVPILDGYYLRVRK